MSAPSEVFDQVEVPEIAELAGGKKSKSRSRSCAKGKRRSQTTGRCRRPCPKACKSEADDEEMLLDEIDDLQYQLYVAKLMIPGTNTQAELDQANLGGVEYTNKGQGPLRPNGMFGGGEMEGGASHRKRKLTMYNKFVMKYAKQHHGKTGKSLIRSAAKAWRAHKGGRSMSRSRSPSKRSRSRSMRR